MASPEKPTILNLHPFNSLGSRRTWVSWYPKDRTILDFNEARDDGVICPKSGGQQWFQTYTFDLISCSVWHDTVYTFSGREKFVLAEIDLVGGCGLTLVEERPKVLERSLKFLPPESHTYKLSCHLKNEQWKWVQITKLCMYTEPLISELLGKIHKPRQTKFSEWIETCSTVKGFKLLTIKNSPKWGLRSFPDLDPDLGWPWKSYHRECLIDL